MDGLRWVLLGCGIFVIVGVILFSRRQQSTDKAGPEKRTAGERVEPSLGDEESLVGGDADIPPIGPAGEQIDIEDVAGKPDPISADVDHEPVEEPTLEADVEQKIVTVRIVASDKNPFPGDQLVLSLRGIGMRHGRFGIFHRYDGNDEDRIVFSAASLVEPGSFQLENIREQKIPGISLFMVLPGPLDGAEAFDQMMAASRTLTQSLGAELLDESGSSLSIQRERYLREEIIQYQHANRLN
jgi:cell division protein ZipA